MCVPKQQLFKSMIIAFLNVLSLYISYITQYCHTGRIKIYFWIHLNHSISFSLNIPVSFLWMAFMSPHCKQQLWLSIHVSCIDTTKFSNSPQTVSEGFGGKLQGWRHVFQDLPEKRSKVYICNLCFKEKTLPIYFTLLLLKSSAQRCTSCQFMLSWYVASKSCFLMAKEVFWVCHNCQNFNSVKCFQAQFECLVSHVLRICAVWSSVYKQCAKIVYKVTSIHKLS